MCFLIESHDLGSRLSKEVSRKFGVMDFNWVAAKIERVYSFL